MLASLKLKLKFESQKEKFDYNKSSVLQGVLMEKIDSDYAEFLHSQGVNPYSMYVYEQNGDVYWCIQTLNEEAYQHIIEPMYRDDFTRFYLKHNRMYIEVQDKQLVKLPYDDLLERTITHEEGKYYTIYFNTPTAFKRAGGYYFFPELANIYQSIANRLAAVTEGKIHIDEESLVALIQQSYITSYNLRTENYHLEKSRVPGFMGSVVIRLNGDADMHDMMRTLLGYGAYSGVGIKTSIGMGAIKVKW